MFWELLSMGAQNLSKRRLRSFLTMLGIFIGIGAVVALISIGSGMESYVTEALESFGPNKIYIMASSGGGGLGGLAGAAFGEPLTDKDVEIVKNVRGVKTAIPLSSVTLPVEYKGEKQTLWIVGIPPEGMKDFFSEVQNLELSKGRLVYEGEKYTTIVGYLVEKDIYSEDVKLRSKLTIKNIDFRVVGFVKRIGNPQDDSQIYISLDTFRKLTGEEDKVTAIVAEAEKNPNEVAKEIERKLEKEHGEDLFMAMTTEQLQEQIQSIFGIISITLGGIASISLVVAGFGIANTMLMSVLERTREIGIMKAIGASNRMVMLVFLTETAILGFVGGVGGIMFGETIYFAVTQISISMLGVVMPIVFSPALLLAALLFSVFVGVLSGLYPAWRASRLDPVEALRYE